MKGALPGPRRGANRKRPTASRGRARAARGAGTRLAVARPVAPKKKPLDDRELRQARTAGEARDEGNASAAGGPDGGTGHGVDLVWDGRSGHAGRRAGNRD